ncbi:MAG: BlaI/MecI/CopY family transcriptional regulator [Planctomycetota bacterium]|nr:MAG: BlaI/MecI/CopY family transcriptional regulator [Planctomycetota bacterium]
MTPDRNHATAAELAVLEVLWQAEPATIRVITERLYPQGGTSSYATVQKLLDRLESKGFVARERSRIPHRFRSRVDRGKLIQHRLRDLADSLCGGSLKPLLTQLVENTRLSEDEIESLRRLIQDQKEPEDDE